MSKFPQLHWPSPMAERSDLADDCSSLYPAKLGCNPGQGSKGINMSVTVTKRR